MDAKDFHYGTRANYFNGWLAQKPTSDMGEATNSTGYYVLGKESNMGKCHQGVQGNPHIKPDKNTREKEKQRYQSHRSSLLEPGWKFHGIKGESFTPLNSRRSNILREMDNLGLIVMPARGGMHTTQKGD